jgi:protein gp37
MLGPVSMDEATNGTFWNAAERRPQWVVCGGETGPGARPMNPAWVRALRDECWAAGVPFFLKHWGEWLPVGAGDRPPHMRPLGPLNAERIPQRASEPHMWMGEGTSFRVGRKWAGRWLDGRLHDEWPREGR